MKFFYCSLSLLHNLEIIQIFNRSILIKFEHLFERNLIIPRGNTALPSDSRARFVRAGVCVYSNSRLREIVLCCSVLLSFYRPYICQVCRKKARGLKTGTTNPASHSEEEDRLKVSHFQLFSDKFRTDRRKWLKPQ